MRLALPALLFLACLASAADGVAIAIPAKGAPAFTVTCPAGWTAAAGAHSTTLIPAEKRPHIQLWAVEDKKDVDAAVADIAAVIVDQVKNFAIAERTETKVDGAKAMLLVGTGEEADDGDPSNAQVSVFTVAGKVWVLVSHGEGEGATQRAKDVAALLKTLAKP